MLWKSMKVENMTSKFEIRGECNLAQRLCSQIPTLFKLDLTILIYTSRNRSWLISDSKGVQVPFIGN
jgi:hypothetical protein